MIETLVRAAQLAESLSQSRQLSIELSIRSDGVLIEGVLSNPSGAVTYCKKYLAPWRYLYDGCSMLDQAIRKIDTELKAVWRKEGQGK